MMSSSERISKAEELKAAGSTLFKAGNFAGAAAEYRKALSQLRAIATGECVEEATTLGVALNTNAAICHLKCDAWEDAISCATKALKLAPSAPPKVRSKALFQRAKAYQKSEHRPNGAELARADLRAAIKLDPKNKPIRLELKRLSEQQRGAGGDAASVDPTVSTGFLSSAALKAKGGTDLYAENEGAQRAARERAQHTRAIQAAQAAQAREQAAMAADPAAVAAAEEFAAARAAEARRAAEEDAKAEAAAEAIVQASAAVGSNSESASSSTPASSSARVADAAIPTMSADELGYKLRADGSKAAYWTRDDAASDVDRQVMSAQDFRPRKLPSEATDTAAEGSDGAAKGEDTGSAAPNSHNAGYAEKNMTEFCTHELHALLEPMRLAIKGIKDSDEDRDGSFSTSRASSVRGEAVITTLRGTHNHIFDFSASVPFTVTIGAAITKEVKVKGEDKKMHLGYPTFRGSFELTDITHSEQLTGNAAKRTCAVSDSELAAGMLIEVKWGREKPTGEAATQVQALLDGAEAATSGPQARLRQMAGRFIRRFSSVTGIAHAKTLAVPELEALPAAPEPWAWQEIGGDTDAGADVDPGVGDGIDGKQEGNVVDANESASAAEQSKGTLPPALRSKMQELRKAGYAVFCDA